MLLSQFNRMNNPFMISGVHVGRGDRAPRTTRVMAVRRSAPITVARRMQRFIENFRGIIPRRTVARATARNTLRRFTRVYARRGAANYRSRAVYRRAVNYRGRY